MATERRRRINRYKQVKYCAEFILCLLFAIGFVAGRMTAPVKVEIVTRTDIVEVPVTSVDAAEVTYFNVPLSHSLQKYIYEICAEENVPVTLVMAMIEHESGFNAEVVSSTDDYGLMQINKVNHEEIEEKYKCTDMTDPYQNVFCGIKIIGDCIDNYGDLSKALMAYNMGDYGAAKAWDEGITGTNYTETILELMQDYETELNNAERS